MAWVDSEYAGELAVVSAWLSALLPWSLTVLSPSQSSESFTFVIIRYTYFQFQFLLGSNLAVESFLWIADLPGFVTPQVRSAAWAAVAAAALFALPLGFSIAYYLAEERVEGLPVDPVRVMGGLLAATAVVYGVATALLWQHKAGLTLPVSPLFLAVFGVTLLRIERT
ncbi:hypothetical protein ACFQMA_03185 [Halosimplex aquaticum]|uniref:TIGR04206 family protein n=1 Tax=Halosimplex aquaticum TaxID=3026162 RepID=A0ABD5XUP5_9EURY|nr:hypothetical protein [Halosimplex aquaticum]